MNAQKCRGAKSAEAFDLPDRVGTSTHPTAFVARHDVRKVSVLMEAFTERMATEAQHTLLRTTSGSTKRGRAVNDVRPLRSTAYLPNDRHTRGRGWRRTQNEIIVGHVLKNLGLPVTSVLPTFTTPRLSLRPVRESDNAAMFVLRSDPVAMQYIARPRARSLLDAERSIQRMLDGVRDGTSLNWGITLRDTDELIGTIGHVRVVRALKLSEVGYMLRPEFHRQGLMHEALEPIVRAGFEDMGLRTLEAWVDPENLGSIKLLAKNDFVLDRTIQEDDLFEGRTVISAVYVRRAEE